MFVLVETTYLKRSAFQICLVGGDYDIKTNDMAVIDVSINHLSCLTCIKSGCGFVGGVCLVNYKDKSKSYHWFKK